MNEAELNARICRLEDHQAIRELSARYALAIDARDYSALSDLFTRDATFGGTSDGALSLIGSDAIVASLRARLDAGGATYHSVHDVLATFDARDPDAASGIVTTHAETRTARDVVIKCVRYSDDYQRISGRWYFRGRLLTFPMNETGVTAAL